MKRNMGSIDKVVRIILSITIIILFLANIITGISATLLLILAGVFLFTTLAGFCPLYLPFNITTSTDDEVSEEFDD